MGVWGVWGVWAGLGSLTGTHLILWPLGEKKHFFFTAESVCESVCSL